MPESIRSKEIVRDVRLQLSDLPPLPVSRVRAPPPIPAPSLFQIMDEISAASLLTCSNAPLNRPKPPSVS